MKAQPWIQSPGLDLALILSPSFLAVLAVLFFRDHFDQTADVPLWAWITFVLCIDVAHVYGTLFRTYFNRGEFKENRTLLTVIPLVTWLAGVLVYSVNALLFWSALAYVAVFHFIRQQYGFMMLYSRNETSAQRRWKWIDKGLIYLATVYPIIYWHTHLPRNFHWFVDGDFVTHVPREAEWLAFGAYGLFILLYAFKEIYYCVCRQTFSIPKQLLILGTALSWYVGIVALNGDMVFTITNIVSHGLPYIGLIWIYGRKQGRRLPEQRLFARLSFRQVFSVAFLPLFFGVLVLLAYLEEGMWDGLVWRDHGTVFKIFSALPKITDSATLVWLVPLLSLPQLTHYVLDGFIWRLRDKKSGWQKVIFQSEVRAS